MGASPVEITKYNLSRLNEVFYGEVMNQTAPFPLDMTAGDRTKITRYGLTSLADVFKGKVIDQTAPFELLLNENNRTTIGKYPLFSLSQVFSGRVMDQTAPFLFNVDSGRMIVIRKKLIDRLDTVFDFKWTERQGYTVPSDTIKIDPKIITSVDQLIDARGIGDVKITDLVNFTISPTDFFFKGVDQIEEISNALNTVFENFPTQMKAQVPLAELVDFSSEGLKPALFDAINDGWADGQVLPEVIRGPG